MLAELRNAQKMCANVKAVLIACKAWILRLNLEHTEVHSVRSPVGIPDVVPWMSRLAAEPPPQVSVELTKELMEPRFMTWLQLLAKSTQVSVQRGTTEKPHNENQQRRKKRTAEKSCKVEACGKLTSG